MSRVHKILGALERKNLGPKVEISKQDGFLRTLCGVSSDVVAT